MKVSVNAILTTLTGGCPVTVDSSKKAMARLLEENTRLNASLPQYAGPVSSKEDLIQANIDLKTEKLFELFPRLKDEMEDEIMVARVALSNILVKHDDITKQYMRICEILIIDAEAILLGPKNRTKLVEVLV